jgi:hypothetical protein
MTSVSTSFNPRYFWFELMNSLSPLITRAFSFMGRAGQAEGQYTIIGEMAP